MVRSTKSNANRRLGRRRVAVAREALFTFIQQFGFLSLDPLNWGALYTLSRLSKRLFESMRTKLPCQCGFSTSMETSMGLRIFIQARRPIARHISPHDVLSSFGPPSVTISSQSAAALRCAPGALWRFATYSDEQRPVPRYGPSIGQCRHRDLVLESLGFHQYNRARMAAAGGYEYRNLVITTDGGMMEFACPVSGRSSPDSYRPQTHFDRQAINGQVDEDNIPGHQITYPVNYRTSIVEDLGLR